MKKNNQDTKEHNIRVFAEQNSHSGGMNLYLEFSGSREFVSWRRKNPSLFQFLRNGIRLDNLHRMSAKDWSRVGGKHLIPRGQQLMRVIDFYLKDRAEEEACEISIFQALPEQGKLALTA